MHLAQAQPEGLLMRTLLTAVLALAAGFVLGGLGAQFLADSSSTGSWQAQVDQLQGQLRQEQLEAITLQARHDALEGQLLVEESTRKSLETSLHSAQAELSSLRERLAFFDQLLPPGPSGSVGIRALDIEPFGSTLYYKALLSRHAVGGKPFSGTLQFLAKGRLNGKPEQLDLKPATAELPPDIVNAKPSASADATAPVEVDPFLLAFDQFQRVEGLLALPPGFVPDSLTVNVLEGKVVRASRRILLDEPASN